MTPAEKECKACSTVKPAADFHKKSARPDGLQIKCKDCTATYRAAYHAKQTDPGVDTATKYRSAPNPSSASPTLGERGDEREKERAIDLSTTSVDSESAPSAPTPNAETDLVAFREGQQSTSDARATVDSTSYPTTRTAVFADLPHAAIVRSKTNPRRHFDPAFIQDLAANVRSIGILQPILVRPLPGHRIEESLDGWIPGNPRPTHEIIAGEQRWRAAGIAGLRTVPAMVRELTDEQVLELQLVENLRRRDLHALEEAEGYELLIKTTGMSVEQVAERIGRKRTYVYGSLSLLRLIPEARTAFYEGPLNRSCAELIARHTETLQPAILKDLIALDHHGEPMSFSRAKEHIKNTYMLQLGTAPFKTDDELLVPEAGPCTTCPMRSGSNPDLFGDFASADTCTNPPCYGNKKAAHYERITIAAEARGQTVIVGKQAREIMPGGGTMRGYTRVDEPTVEVSGGLRSLRGVLGEDLPATTLIEDPTTHELIEALPTAEAGKLLRDRKPKAKATPTPAAAEPSVDEIARAYELAWRTRAIRAVVEAPDHGQTVSIEAQIRIAVLLLQGLPAGPGLDLLGELAKAGKIGTRDGIAEHLACMPSDALRRWLYVLMMARDLDAPRDPAEHIKLAAIDHAVDLESIQALAKKELKPEAPAAPIAAPAPVKPGRTPRVKKTIEEFNQALVEGLRNAGDLNAFNIGERVRIKADITRGVDVFHTRGMPGAIVDVIGDRKWLVQPDDLNMPLTIDYTEIEPL